MASDPVLIESHEEEMLERLISFFDNAENVKKLLSIAMDQVQDIEQTMYDLWWLCLLENAEGVQLDQYGRVLGQSRMELGDDDYRKMLLVRVQINRGQGEVTRLIDVMTKLVNDTVWYRGVYPAFFSLVWFVTPAMSGNYELFLKETVLELTPAGVGYEILEAPAVDAFRFDIGPGLDEGKLGRIVDSVGG